MRKTAMSSIIYEVLDFSTGVFTRDAKLIGQAAGRGERQRACCARARAPCLDLTAAGRGRPGVVGGHRPCAVCRARRQPQQRQRIPAGGGGRGSLWRARVHQNLV